jgi:predicted CoA-binding protein
MENGYPQKSLVEKLGIKRGFKIIVLNPPQNYHSLLGKLPDNVILMKELKGPLDFIHLFTKERQELEDKFPILKQEVSPNGIIWISWPKRSSVYRLI